MRMRRVSRASECVHGASGDETRAMLGTNVHAMHLPPPVVAARAAFPWPMIMHWPPPAPVLTCIARIVSLVCTGTRSASMAPSAPRFESALSFLAAGAEEATSRDEEEEESAESMHLMLLGGGVSLHFKNAKAKSLPATVKAADVPGSSFWL